MSYLIKEKLMRDTSDQGDSVTSADSAVGIEENCVEKKRGRIEDPALSETKMENVEVAAYRHFPADNVTEVNMSTYLTCDLRSIVHHQMSSCNGIQTEDEVWLNIFEKLNTEDKITFSKTCRELHNWVATKRTRFHFREVVPILALTSNLPKRDLLKCRVICKSWTSDFNRVYPANPSHFCLKLENERVLENEVSQLDNDFRSSEQFQRFLEEMNSHHGNPFPGRSIRLLFELPQATRSSKAVRLRLLREYHEKAIELLEMYGFHVHMAVFDLCDFDLSSELEVMEIYNYFRRCLLHMSNLKKLEVEEETYSPFLEEHLAFYRQNMLPQLPHLETIWMTGTSRLIWNGVLESSCVPHIVKRLVLLPGPEESEHLRIPEAAYFPNLAAFEVGLFIEHLERFLNILEGTLIPPVGTVTLNSWEDQQDFGRVFRSLEALAGSLTCLKLYLDFSEDSLRHTVATGFAINLPQLERLEVIGYNGPLDPFCHLPALKFLTIERSQYHLEESSDDFYGNEVCMEKLNIWEKIPSLKEFHFRSYRDTCKTYHRDMLQLSPSE